MHTTITDNGRVSYRTRLMSLARARHFALCLQANRRFQGVMIHQSKARKDLFFVTYRPSSTARAEALIEAQQESRAARANTQADGFDFWPSDVSGLFHCHSHASKSNYLVSIDGCNCRDFRVRCQEAGLRCKHSIALAAYLAAQRTSPAPVAA